MGRTILLAVAAALLAVASATATRGIGPASAAKTPRLAATPVVDWSNEARRAIVPAGPGGIFGAENYGNKLNEARVLAGLHVFDSDQEGSKLGREVGRYVVKHLFQRLKNDPAGSRGPRGAKKRSPAAVSPARSQASYQDNAVVNWNRVAVDAVLADSATRTPSAAALYVAIVQAAVYDATMAIEKTHEPYLSAPLAPRGASVDAAVAAAAHDVLIEYFRAQQATLDAEYNTALADIPDGDAKEDGVTVGQQAAARIIAARDGDGRFALVADPPDGDEPGEWRRTSPGAAVTPWTAHVRPFLVRSPDQFRPKGPNMLTSKRYAEQFNETRLYGAKTGSLRTPEQTEIAVFWTENTVGQYNRALRVLADERGLSAGATARLFGMTALTGADGMITCWNTKYHYLFWRPVTAIREADADSNPATDVDPDWEPLSATANHPEYTSGHACLTGAVTRALQGFLGTKRIDFTMDSTATGTVPHRFATVDDLRLEVENARIYGGDHFRVGGSDGTKAGDGIAKWALKRFFQPRRAST